MFNAGKTQKFLKSIQGERQRYLSKSGAITLHILVRTDQNHELSLDTGKTAGLLGLIHSKNEPVSG